MSKGFTIKITGVEQAINKLKNVKDDIVQEIDDEVAAGVEKMARQAKRDAPKDTGFLTGKISAVPIKPLEWELVAQSNYAAYMEFGTKGFVDIPAGLEQYAAQFKGSNNSGGVKLKDAIYAWCKRKGIPKERWWFIYRQIRDKGVKPHPFFFRNVFAVRPEIVRNIVNIIREKR
jgi:hypothetical protein